MSERALGKMTAVLSDLGLEVTYAYDDLVFVQHSAFILQFTDDPGILNLYINTECEPDEALRMTDQIIAASAEKGFTIQPQGTCTISQNEDETLNIEFD